MGEAYNEREILLRLNKLEKRLSDKDSVIDRLNSKIKNLETELKQFKSDRVVVIDSLKQKIDSIETQLHELLLPASPPASASDPPPAAVKEKKDILIIGDSIVKHLDASNITTKLTDVKCFPGARCDRILSELSALLKHYEYDHIICHVGTNYIPQHDPQYVSNRIIDFLTSVRLIAPQSKVTWSPILPKWNDSMKKGINTINNNIFNRHHMIKRMSVPMNHVSFLKNSVGQVNTKLFCHDGCHLSYEGVTALENSMKWHLSNI